jgi:hypothetical protein
VAWAGRTEQSHVITFRLRHYLDRMSQTQPEALLVTSCPCLGPGSWCYACSCTAVKLQAAGHEMTRSSSLLRSPLGPLLCSLVASSVASLGNP